ncbi:mevalonate kinase [Loigolactobacillus backii]|uniref:mevalonate kinase n=1 Tax=Loigolactobacillus backii TaxID=375175 RepID=UPI0007F153DF|nr:mevalonate kinase [Loigolactobacillus backii]ANK59530.1 mevalonate kinase [Loigolactobacillus backii]ANK64523.1 mevalonate kinase [Loigolactobacillus backii]ANK67081.1 mevalonate kinase [Loigolactobacillus backii]OLF70676.1 mevalonate kinase [Loigolactobacillus backii]PIO87726.1 mevalonate kinase [Loigolactobacillus backii]
MTLAEGIGVSNAKIILIGEHSAVYGQPAIVIPLTSIQLTASTTPIQSGQYIDSNYYTGPLQRAYKNLAGVKKLILTVLQQLNQTNANFKLTIKSAIPSERGMGSSAAAAIAIIRSLYAYFEQPLNRATLLRLANVAETVTHGNPSGMDAATTSAHAPIWFVRGEQSHNLPINASGYLVIADSGMKGQTGPAVATVRDRLADFPQETDVFMKQLGALAVTARDALANNQLTTLGTCLSHAQIILQTLGVSNYTIDHLVFLAQHNGSLGTKLTGGGRGGCIIALAPDKATATHLIDVLTTAGATQTWLQPLAHLNAANEVQN